MSYLVAIPVSLIKYNVKQCKISGKEKCIGW